VVIRPSCGTFIAVVDAGVSIIEFDDEDALLSVKCSDPDGYVVEVYWEP
jgi:hypothetical protein